LNLPVSRTRRINFCYLKIVQSTRWGKTYPLIPVLGRLKQEDLEFVASLDYMVRMSKKNDPT
jgi:hypothetical protein